jgi:hypothetical protein
MNKDGANSIDSDNEYAKAIQVVLDESGELLPVELSRKLYEVNTKYYPDFEGPQNLMLQEVYGEILGGRLDPVEARSMGYDTQETLEEIRVITSDYLSGNFYPTYFLLTISYRRENEGYICLARVNNSSFIIESAHQNIQEKVREVGVKIAVSEGEKKALLALKSHLPNVIDDLILDAADLQELLA